MEEIENNELPLITEDPLIADHLESLIISLRKILPEIEYFNEFLKFLLKDKTYLNVVTEEMPEWHKNKFIENVINKHKIIELLGRKIKEL